MFIGMLLIGTVIGAVSSVVALVFGYSLVMAAVIYSGVGAAATLAGAAAMAFRSGPARPGQDHPRTILSWRRDPGQSDLAPASRGS